MKKIIKTSIVILTCGKNKYIRKCVDSIKRNTKNFEIIVVDNGSDPKYQGYGTVIRNDENLGFPKGVNQGIKRATGEIIVLLNDDTLVTPNWLDHLSEHLKTYDIVGPVTNSISGPQMLDSVPDDLTLKLSSFSQSIYSENRKKVDPFHRLVFYCVAIKREVIDKIGLLDEQFSPGNFEDDDFCLRAIEAGFKLGIARDTFIYHYGSATFNEDNIKYQKLLETNKIKFENKWSKKKYHELAVKCVGGAECVPNKNANDLALVMVVKNEAKGLERAILSARPYVKEIVIVVDDASNDGTYKIAEKHADVVKNYKWKNDFSDARNFAHAGVKSKWIMFLDGHEILEEMPDISQDLKSEADGFLITVKMENGVVFRALRIYKNGIQFDGEYHELAQSKKVAALSQVVIKHDRLCGQEMSAMLERTEQRNSEIPKVLGAQLKRDPKNTRASFHLAMHAQAVGDFKGALKYQSLYFRYAKKKGDRWFVYFNRAICLLALGRLFRAYWAISMADREIPDRWESAKMKGLIFYQKGWYQNALENFIGSFKVNTGDVSFKPWPRDEGGTWNLIGECFFHQKFYFKAGVAFARASESTKDKMMKDVLKKRSELMHKMAGAK